MSAPVSDLVARLRHLVSLNEPRHGGPYGGFAAEQCVRAMTEAAARISELEAALARSRFVIGATDACLKTWNHGRGSPANVDGILAYIDALLAGGKRDG